MLFHINFYAYLFSTVFAVENITNILYKIITIALLYNAVSRYLYAVVYE